MISLEAALQAAPINLRIALRWFHDRRGTEIGWPSPSPVPEVDHVVTSAKGIYKPAEHSVALSVRQTLNSRYADQPPVDAGAGRWVYAYHQEGVDPAARDADFTNQGLIENLRQQVPVAVLIQTNGRPNVRYKVQGLALVVHWDSGYFYLAGFGDDDTASTSGDHAEDLVIRQAAGSIASSEPPAGFVDPTHDARIRTVASIVRRQGQGRFRESLLQAYRGRCAITGCGVPDVLDAAHIQPYRGEHTNHVQNGLLLRSDIHSLFDLGMLAIEPNDRNVIVSDRLSGTDYGDLLGRRVAEPEDPQDRPVAAVLRAHLDWCGERLAGSW